MRPKRRMCHDIFEPWIEIRMRDASALKAPEDLDSAQLVTANAKGLALFGLLVPCDTFGSVRQRVLERDDGRWRAGLFHVINKIARGHAFYPVQAVFEGCDGRICRPVLLAVDRAGPLGPIETFHISFAEEVSSPDTAAMPRNLAVLASLLRFTFRFRWEVLEQFARPDLNATDVEHCDISLKRIQTDWYSRGTISEDEMASVFTPVQAVRLRNMTETWRTLRKPDFTGELDRALEDRDGRRVGVLLRRFLPMNQEFLEMAAERFAELIGNATRPHIGAQTRP